eukprot:9606057-Alexandrium_andersonii.AAC.1
MGVPPEPFPSRGSRESYESRGGATVMEVAKVVKVTKVVKVMASIWDSERLEGGTMPDTTLD